MSASLRRNNSFEVFRISSKLQFFNNDANIISCSCVNFKSLLICEARLFGNFCDFKQKNKFYY